MVEGNPCIEYIKYIIFPWFNQFEIKRNEANGGDKIYTNMDDLIADYTSGALHPGKVCSCLGGLRPIHLELQAGMKAFYVLC